MALAPRRSLREDPRGDAQFLFVVRVDHELEVLEANVTKKREKAAAMKFP